MAIISEQTCMMSFSQGNYSIMEDEKVVTVSVKRSGCSHSLVVVLIATHPSEGTATGKYIQEHMSRPSGGEGACVARNGI